MRWIAETIAEHTNNTEEDVFALLKAKWSLKKLLLLKGDRLIKKGDAILLFGRHGDRTFPKSGL